MPALALCPQFDGDPAGNEDTSIGTLRHEAFAAALRGDDSKLKGLPEEDRTGTEWAIEYVKANSSAQEPLHIELKRSLLDYEDFSEIMSGTPDVTQANHVFDLKWRRRNYSEQMAAYALMQMYDTGFDFIRVHILFALERRIETYTITLSEAEPLVQRIVRRARDPKSVPVTNEYCDWCARRLTCPAILQQVVEVAQGYGETGAAKQWHPSKMESGVDISNALWLWRTVLKKWGDSIEFHALDAATRKGITLPGFEVKQRKSKPHCKDVVAAFQVSKLEQDKFLLCCDLRLNTSKTHKDRVGIFDLYAELQGMPKAAAKRELSKALDEASAMSEVTLSNYLKATKTEGDSESDFD
jgi:hypothetical protein